MEIFLQRRKSGNIATLGDLQVNGKFECHTLEDVVREIPGQHVSLWKVHGKTAIPQGRYEVILTWSNRFNRVLPLLIEVPGFTGIRIHAGNTAANTDGCILTGQYYSEDSIQNSRAALEILMAKIKTAIEKDKQRCWITVKNYE